MGGKNSVSIEKQFLDSKLTKKIKEKVKNLLSSVEEKIMRILVLLDAVNNNSFYSRILLSLIEQGTVLKLLEKIDYIAWEANDSLDMLHYELYNLFDEHTKPVQFRNIRHAISGDTYNLYSTVMLCDDKQTPKKWNGLYDWVFNVSEIPSNFFIDCSEI